MRQLIKKYWNNLKINKQARHLKHKQYELKDHLGNVRVIVSDFKKNNTAAHSNPPYKAEVLSVYNYYPFGMLQPDMYAENNDPRTRFGFNGMLRDDDIKDKFSTSPDDEGRGNSYATHFRMYDPRVARWFSIDPLVAQFPFRSPYNGLGNNPVIYVDIKGSDEEQRNKAIEKAYEYLNSESTYGFGEKGIPGEPCDCSGLIENSVEAGGEPNPNVGYNPDFKGRTSGVLNIEANTEKVELNTVEPGNIVSFNNQNARWPYHMGLITSVDRDDKDKTTITFIHMSGSANRGIKSSFIVGDKTYWGRNLSGFYKWDTIPDKQKNINNRMPTLKGVSPPR